jgi:hypothetical protein
LFFFFFFFFLSSRYASRLEAVVRRRSDNGRSLSLAAVDEVLLGITPDLQSLVRMFVCCLCFECLVVVVLLAGVVSKCLPRQERAGVDALAAQHPLLVQFLAWQRLMQIRRDETTTTTTAAATTTATATTAESAQTALLAELAAARRRHEGARAAARQAAERLALARQFAQVKSSCFGSCHSERKKPLFVLSLQGAAPIRDFVTRAQ